ncbi:hypothetical protein RCL1_006170 [Eukaryota sp. TZLM3-RCL]
MPQPSPFLRSDFSSTYVSRDEDMAYRGGSFGFSYSPPPSEISAPDTEAEVSIDALSHLGDLLDETKREQALEALSRKRDTVSSLAVTLWNSVGVMTVLLQEILSTYHLLLPPVLSSAQSTRVNHALSLLQVVAAHPKTKMLLLEANIHLYLFPFLATHTQSKPFEYLRLSSLAVIGALLKSDLPIVVPLLLKTEIVPLCLRIMDSCQITARTVATFTIHRIISEDAGLAYVTTSADRFATLHKILRQNAKILLAKRDPVPQEQERVRKDDSDYQLMRLLLRCWTKLAENAEAATFLRNGQLPFEIVSGSVVAAFAGDRSVAKYQKLLLELTGL